MSSIFGIDLGTTFSAIARVDGQGQVMVIPNREGAYLTPSVVYFAEDGSVEIGESARQRALSEPDRTVQTAKRRMGDPSWMWEFHGHFYQPQDIAALLLRQLKQDAERTLHEPVRDIVLTVPAHFGDPQRTATIEAARHAGLNPLRLLNEPTAAALSFGREELPDEGLVMVVDLGGGTLDITILEAVDGWLQAKATNGHAECGGEDWDSALLHHAAVQCISAFGVDPLDDPFTYQEWRERCIKAKHRLSIEPSVEWTLECEGHTLTMQLTQQEFASLSRPLLSQIENLCQVVFSEVSASWRDFQKVLLVGGASQMPMIEEHLRALGCEALSVSKQPALAVVHGAAYQAAQLANPQPPTEQSEAKYIDGTIGVEDINSHTLGLLVLDRQRQQMVDPIIPKYTPLPYEKRYRYYTAHNGQVSVQLQLVEGESANPQEMIIIGQAEITGLPPRPAGQPVDLTFTYDESGQLTVGMFDVGSGQHQQVVFQRTSSRSMQELELMRRLLLAHPLR